MQAIVRAMYQRKPRKGRRKVLGTISVGQAPDMPISIESQRVLGEDVEILEVGLWDGYTKKELEKYKPEPGVDILLGQTVDGTDFVYAERYVPERLQSCVDRLEKQSCDLIMVYCAGKFSFPVKSSVPFIRPGELARAIVPHLLNRSRILVLIPPGFEEQWKEMWNHVADEVFTLAVWSEELSYDAFFKSMEAACDKISEIDPDLIVMDCMGYDDIMRDRLIKITGRRAVHTRGLALNVIKQVLI